MCVCQSPKSKLFILFNYGWILDFEFHHLWRKLSYRSLVRSPIETSVLATRGTCVFIFLLSVCNVLLPLECAVKFWHSACFILNFWDNFCNFLCKIKYGSIRLIKKAWSMVIISIRKISKFYNSVTLVKVMKNENALVGESRMEFY